MFIDEAGFYLLPMLVRTYAPVGQTPVLRVPLTHDHLSAIGGLTQKGGCSCRCKSEPIVLKTWSRFYACCCARSRASSW